MFEDIGTFEVKSGNVIVSDPCYQDGDGGLYRAKNGTWKASVRRSDEGTWGVRVAALRVTHESFHGEPTTVIGSAGVDSGQMSVSDGELFHLLPGDDYDKACKLTLRPESCGIVDGYAAVSSSGYGDGSYEIRAAQEHGGALVGIEVVFIHEPLKCAECGCEFQPQESYDESYCEECYLDLFESEECSICGSRVPNDQIHDGMCEGCSEECDACGEVVANEELVDGYCEDCRQGFEE